MNISLLTEHSSVSAKFLLRFEGFIESLLQSVLVLWPIDHNEGHDSVSRLGGILPISAAPNDPVMITPLPFF